MLTVDEAFEKLLAHVQRSGSIELPLNETLGLILAEDVVSDIDSPPFDKSMMDGFAIRTDDLQSGGTTLRIVETITAGDVPQQTVSPGESARIMTGAQIPAGIDAVVPIEQTEFTEGDSSVRILLDDVPTGKHVIGCGTNVKAGQTIFEAGTRIRPQEIGGLAEFGHATIRVFPQVTVSVLATGNELVPVDQTPGPGQIRNSNEPMLAAQIQNAGAKAVPLGVARDERTALAEKIQAGMKADIMLLSGGVSAGQLDLVPSELAAAGVQEVFHKIQMKPGKPLWYGVHESRNSDGETRHCHVFGLPGNPVSSMVCFELFCRTAIRRLMGMEPVKPPHQKAQLAEEFHFRGGRPTYHPAELRHAANGIVAKPVRWGGSSDLVSTAAANGMVYFPPEERAYEAGALVDVISW